MHLKTLITCPFQRTSYPLFRPLSLRLCSTTTSSQSHTFAVSYLINNLGFSPQSALNASKRLRFDAPDKPDSVIAFLKSHGFSGSQISSIVRREPSILLCNPQKSVLPKFGFLASKGASNSDIVLAANRSPRLLTRSLENCIVPSYELVRSFLQSDKRAICCIIGYPGLLAGDSLSRNLKLLMDGGVPDSTVRYLFGTRPSVLLSHDFREVLDEVKKLGFDPKKLKFGIALLAKLAVPKSTWDAKVDALKSWGWSEEAISKAFGRHPCCMLTSKDKINGLMRLWVNQLGWDCLAPVKWPCLFGYSLERRIVPRALVVQYLLAKGLINKNDSLYTPFAMSEKLFLQKYVECFVNKRSRLLKIYQEKKSCLR